MARNRAPRGCRLKTPQATEFIKLLESVSDRHRTGTMFDRFLEAAACALSNRIDRPQREAREKRYLELIENDPKLQRAFGQLLAIFIRALEREPHDFFGEVTQALGIVNGKGQVWTPYHLSSAMSALVLQDVTDIIREKGYASILEPCSGPGGMIMAVVEAAKKNGLDPTVHVCLTAIDIDPRCVHMTYLVCCALGVPAVVHHANALDLQTPPWSSWFTPRYLRDGWHERLAAADRAATAGSEQEPALQLAAE